MILTILSIIVLVFVIGYLNGIYHEVYWKRRGVPFNWKNRYLGPMFEFLCSNKPGIRIIQNIYDLHPDAPAIGVSSFIKPTLLIKDLENIQHVLATNFNSFNHRGIETNDGDFLADNIIFNNGNRWKLVRHHMSRIFTPIKLKHMYYIMDKSAQDFTDYLKRNPQYLKGDAFNTLSTFCCAALGASVFGIGTESIFESPFLKMSLKATNFTPLINFFLAIVISSPKLGRMMGVKLFKEHEEFFIAAVKQIIRAREKDPVKRHDFADVCVSLQQNGILKDPDTGLEIKPTDEFLAAQAFFFFLAGVEPSAISMFATLVELGKHPDALARVHEEIDEIFQKHASITHDVLSEMKNLDMAIKEAMRIHPALTFVSRKCTRDTVLPVGNIKIDKGTHIMIPIYSIHHDPKLYPHPEVFDPERFSNENKHNIADAAYMPFGRGQRICLGNKYAELQMKAGLVHLLRDYSVKTVIEGDKLKHKKILILVRMKNANVEFIPRH